MLHQQAWAFLIAFLSGAVSAAIFDVYRVVRRLLGLRKIGTALGDFFTLMIIALTAFWLLLIGNWAEMRLYIAVGIAGGLIVYFKTISQLLQQGVYLSIKALFWSIRMLIKAIVLPCRLILKILFIPLLILARMSHLILRISQYMFSFPQLAVFSWYSRVIRWLNPPTRP